MRTATITFHDTKSFGAVLQAYSLQHYLISLGIENQIVDFKKNNTSFNLYRPVKNVKDILINLDSFVHRESIISGNRAFRAFIDEYLIKTNTYCSLEDLKKNPPEADVYITGSDQVWSVGGGIESAYFLDYGKVETKRISYAASMGKSVLSKEQIGIIKPYLDKFSAISVREESAKNELAQHIDKNIVVNIDPVFLTSADEWRKLEKPVTGLNRPYILCFMIYRPDWKNRELRRLKERTGKDVVLLDPSSLRNIYCNGQVRDAGPREFLWLIDHADIIATTSFHGVAFSTIFGKPFYAVVNPQSPERIVSLMRLFKCESSIVNNFQSSPFNYDRDYISKTIEEERERTSLFIKQVVSGVNHD